MQGIFRPSREFPRRAPEEARRQLASLNALGAIWVALVADHDVCKSVRNSLRNGQIVASNTLRGLSCSWRPLGGYS